MKADLPYFIEFISVFRVFFATIGVLFMKSFFQVIALIGTFSVSTLYAAEKPQVELQTNKGMIVFELMPDKAPKSVENFLLYVKDGFYNHTIIHRVIPDYTIQGGGYDDKQTKKETTHPSIANEAENGVKNTKGTVAVARKAEPHSGTSQFFINMKDNNQLNYTGKTDSKTWGYAVFAKVIKGMDILEQIQDLETNQDGPFKYFPIDPVIVESVTLKEEEPKSSKKAVSKDKKTDAKLDKEEKKSEKKSEKTDKKSEKKAVDNDEEAAKDAAEDAADADADKKPEKKDKKSEKKVEKKVEKKESSEEDQAAKDAAEDAADAAAEKAASEKSEKKDTKASSKKVEKKVEKKESSEEDQAAKDAAEDAADAAAEKAAAASEKAHKKDEKKSEKKVEKKSEKKDEKAKTKDAGDAPDEPAAE